MKIYSKLDHNILLCEVYSPKLKEFIPYNRVDFTPDNEFLQAASIVINNGKKFQAHKHIECIRTSNITQEAWIIIQGKVLVNFYDLDNSYIGHYELEPCDCFIAYRGGHSFECLADNTFVYEFKLGPYYGRDKDKEFIDE